MTKIVIVGAAGRMGLTLIRCASKMSEVEIVGAVDRDNHPDLGKDSGLMANIGENGLKLSFDLEEALAGADALIDFTLHDAVPGNIAIAAGMRRAVVLGATGLTEEEAAVVESAADVVPVVWAPNMSLGVNLLFACLKKAGETLGSGYSVEIDETHHIHKKDAPSGTALHLGQKVAEGLNINFADSMIHDPDGSQQIKDPEKIVIRSFRQGEVVGDHTTTFRSEGETISFTHNAHSREAFAMGALRAAEWVTDKKPRIYDMQDVLGL